MRKSNFKSAFFITGATGLVGSYLLKILLQNSHKIYALSRSKDNKSAKERIVDILNFWDKRTYPKYGHNLHIIEGELPRVNMGLNRNEGDLLRKEVEGIFHCAALTKFNWPLKEIRKVNVEGARGIFDLALQCPKLRKVNYISTAYVCGDYKGIFRETDLDKGQKFNTTYEQSKFEAERVVNEYRCKGLWVDIFRPAIITGEASTGKAPSLFQNFYQLLRLWSMEIFDVFPGKDVPINIIPVDLLCKIIIRINSNSDLRNETYHTFSPKPIFLEDMIDAASKLMGFKRPKLVTFSDFSRYPITPIQKRVLKSVVFSFCANVTLNAERTIKTLEKFGLQLPDMEKKVFLKLIEYPLKVNKQ